MYHGSHPGWIEVVTGVMFSGKSEEMIRRVRRAVIAKKRAQVFKSHLDDRYAGLYSISTHDGATVEAQPINTSMDIVRLVPRPPSEVLGEGARVVDTIVMRALQKDPDRRFGSTTEFAEALRLAVETTRD